MLRRWTILGVLLVFQVGCFFEPGPLASRQCGTDLDCPESQVCLAGYCSPDGDEDPEPTPEPAPLPDPDPTPEPEGGCDPPPVWYEDGDGDGFGVEGRTVTACERPDGHANRPGDCNDTDSTVSPEAEEICDARDNDCDGLIDSEDDSAVGVQEWFADPDVDGWGDDADVVQACLPPSGYIAKGGDCDSTNPEISPDIAEVCDGVDNDCDGLIDVAATDCAEALICDAGRCVAVADAPCTVDTGCEGDQVCFRGTCTPPVSLPGVTGQWDFADGLTATIGADLSYQTPSFTEPRTDFGTTTDFGVPDMLGGPASVMHFRGRSILAGYRMTHGVGPNGGGSRSNQYTLIMDILYDTEPDGGYRSFFQTNPDNVSDGDLFINPDRGIGISGDYDGEVVAGRWQRVAFVVDMSAPEGQNNIFKYIDGVLVGVQRAGNESDDNTDNRWSMQRVALLFADDTAETWPGYVSSVQIRNYPMNAFDIALLGGPDPAGIPQ